MPLLVPGGSEHVTIEVIPLFDMACMIFFTAMTPAPCPGWLPRATEKCSQIDQQL